MKRTILLLASMVACIAPLSAQKISEQIDTLRSELLESGRIFRTETAPYNTRHDADSRAVTKSEHYIEFAPKSLTEQFMGQSVDIPYAWTDGNTYLHLEGIGSPYTLVINGNEVARVDDPITPAEFAIKRYVKSGENVITLTLHDTEAESINGSKPIRGDASGSYLYSQNARSVRDFTIALRPDSTEKFGVLDLDIVAQNTFNYTEEVTVGYDIYSPDGKLMELNIQDIGVEGQSTDTMHFSPYIYHTYKNRWIGGGKGAQPLYKVMIFTRRNEIYREYMPLKIGFSDIRFEDGAFTQFGETIELKKVQYNAAKSEKTTRQDLTFLKSKGHNTITPDYPQPRYFYQICDSLGLMVIDCVNINAPDNRQNRRVGGTPSNDPTLRKEYIERTMSAYYRSRNFTCVIAYSLGLPSGNGYNMYKAYEWLKGVEKRRAVIYSDAAGEFNSDL